MLFGKLLPREGNFFELFNQHGAYIAEGARAFIRLIQHYADPELRDKHASEVGHAERQADKITAEVNRLLHKLPRISQPDVAQAALKTCEEIDRLESDADRVMRSAMSRLFREEKDVRELIKLRAIYELLESISDRCEDVANLIEGVVLENS